MNRRRLTIAALVLMLAGIASQPSRSHFDIDVDVAGALPPVEAFAEAEAAVKVGVAGLTLLVTWSRD